MNIPYLSVVVTARNDDHGGNLLGRMQLFLDGLSTQVEQFGLDLELIVVEWNPPPDRPGLARVLSWPEKNSRLTVRIIQVPPEVHQRYKHADSLPLYQMVGKNVGIRRARGEFILVTNIDILFSDDLFRFLSSRNLEFDRMYRVDRHDIPANMPSFNNWSELQDYCRNSVIRLNVREGTKSFLTGEFNEIYPEWAHQRYVSLRERLHTNACGDFTLLHRGFWRQLRGYPEFDSYSFHLDSILCYAAHFGGARELVLEPPMVAYHIEHSGGYAPEKSRAEELRQSLSDRKIPVLSNDQFDGLAVNMTERRRALILAGEDWGLGRDDLPEEIIHTASWDSPGSPAVKEDPSGDSEYYLSLVAAGRHDDHGRGFLTRCQSFLDVLAGQCARYGLKAELIIVDWNTPPDKPPLDEVLVQPAGNGYLDLKFIRVPAEVHQRMDNHDQIPFFQMIAKNVGIRRASGKFVLATNLDVILSNDMVHFLAQKELRSGVFYRADRYDLASRFLPEEASLDQIMDFCRLDVIRIHEKEGRRLHTNACGDFTLMSKNDWLALEGYPEHHLYSIYIDAILLNMADIMGMKEIFLPDPYRVYHLEHDDSWAVTTAPAERMPSLDYHRDVLPLYNRMKQTGRTLNPNGPDWGLAGENLTMTEGPGDRDQNQTSLRSSNARPAPEVRNVYADFKKEMDEITFFAVPKPFFAEFDYIQRNAIRSWTKILPQSNIVLLADEFGTAKAAADYGLRHVPDVKVNEFGTPLVSDIFQKAQDIARSGILVYINADMILTSDFIPAVRRIRSRFREFLMVGQRWDVDIKGFIDYEDAGWEKLLRDYVGKRGVLHDVEGIDYFVFTRGLWPEIPPFALGRCSWDNWLVWQPVKKVQPVIDATSMIMAVHQNHGYSHVKGGKQFAWYGPEATLNRRMTGGAEVLAGVTASANWELTGMGLLPRPAGNHEKIKNIRKAQSCHQLGVDQLEEGRLEEAIENFNEAVNLCAIYNSTISKAYLGKAIAQLRLGRVAEALQSVQKELAINPGHQPSLRLLAQIESRAGRMG